MCIRTTGTLYCAAKDRLFGSPVSAVISLIIDAPAESAASVSYTHLTLPTIYSV